MKTFLLRLLFLVIFLAPLGAAQEVIPLYQGTAPGSTQENYPEKEYFSKVWNTEVVTNVTKPTLTVFKPSPELKNGTAVVICPGGGYMALSITSEGIDVAKYLVAKGVTAFVLKYRLAHTGDDATQEFTDLIADRKKFEETVGKVIPSGGGGRVSGSDLRSAARFGMGSFSRPRRYCRIFRRRRSHRRSGLPLRA